MNLDAKYLFFDLDDTLTPNKTVMENAMFELLDILPHVKVIVSGANVLQIAHQTRGLAFYKLGQNGNHAVDLTNALLWEEQLSTDELETIQKHVDTVKNYVSHTLDTKDTASFNNGCQVSFSLVKQGTERTIKEKFDPERKIRRKILEAVPCLNDSIKVTMAGATSFDYMRNGMHKGFYVQKFIDNMGWNKKDCLYFGDSFYPGGNDEPVIGVIETVEVKDHNETYEHLLQFKQQE